MKQMGNDACDAAVFGSAPSYFPDGRCRCTICARCGHHTGNSHQGHYWKWCKQEGQMLDDWHFCCPDLACEHTDQEKAE